MTTDPLLAVSGVSKCYQRYGSPWQRLLGHFSARQRARAEAFWALQDVSFALYPGQTLGVIGRNGSGKSTLLQIISGTLQPTTGSVQRSGRIAALLELGAGFNPEFTGRENVYLNGAIYGLSRAQVQARLEQILAFADIGDFIDEPVKHYSSGMFVRLAFAVIAHVDADILIIDEALAVGDALFASKCMRFLEGFRQRGAILFVSHDTGTVIRLCDEVLWLHLGRQVQLGPARAVSEAYIESLYADQAALEPPAEQAVSPQEFPAELSARLAAETVHDARRDLLLNSNLANGAELQPFTFDGDAFGSGKAVIVDVCFRADDGRRLSHLTGGEVANLELRFRCEAALEQLIAGFLFKDRQGQILFGENSLLFYREQSPAARRGELWTARFRFLLPYLPPGEYLITASVASGTQAEHVMHCWRHDALVFTVLASHVVHGIIGVPVTSCQLFAAPDSCSENVGET